LRASTEVSSTSLQSAHDTEASYRSKESGNKSQKIKGYSANLTENCSPDELNLILSAQVENASHADSNYFQEAINKVCQVLGKTPKEISTDGAYNSPANLKYLEELGEKMGKEINWYLSAIQGRQGNYDFEWNEQKELAVTDRKTQESQIASCIKPSKNAKNKDSRYRINSTGKSKYRYFKQSAIDCYFRRQEIEELPKEIRNIRPNVEATIHQVFCSLNGQKSKYRGLLQHCHFVHFRCFWVNFKRITAKIQGIGRWKAFGGFFRGFIYFFLLNTKIWNIKNENINIGHKILLGYNRFRSGLNLVLGNTLTKK
jgi:hypothetical protein